MEEHTTVKPQQALFQSWPVTILLFLLHPVCGLQQPHIFFFCFKKINRMSEGAVLSTTMPAWNVTKEIALTALT